MFLPLRDLLLLTTMTMLALSVGVPMPAAELAWSTDLTADFAPGWTTTVPPDAAQNAAKDLTKTPIRFENGRLRVNIEPHRYANVSRTLDGLDGSDEKPLRVEARIAYEGPSPLLGQPAVIALQWAPRQIVAVGVAAWEPNNPNGESSRRRGWAWWDDSRSRGTNSTLSYPTIDGGFIQARILVTSKVVRAFVSSDGLNWQTVAVLEREDGRFVGAPKLVIMGRGVLADEKKADATMGLTNGWGDATWKEPAPFVFSGVRVTNEPPAAPVLPYAKGEDWDATWLTAILPGIPTNWEVLGPFGRDPWPDFGRASTDGAYRGQDGKDRPWRAHAIVAPTSQVLNLRAILAGNGGEMWYLARTTLNVPKRGQWRLWTEASCRNTRMYVDGRLARDGGSRDTSNLAIDGGSAVLDLEAGPHRVVFGVLSHWDQNALLSFRAEPDDAAGRIAIAQRLGDDFPDEVDRGQELRFASGGMWESAGYPLLAVQVWNELAKQPNVSLELAARALGACARVHQELLNRAAAEAAIQDLVQRRLQDADAPTAIAAHLSLARLWDQQGFPERADAEVEQALAVVGISIDQQLDLLLERARRHARALDLKAVDTDLTALLTRLPATHPERAALMELALSARLNAGGDPAAIMTAVAHDAGLTAQLNQRLAGLYGARDDARHGLAALKSWADGADPDPAPWTDADVVYAELLLTKANTLPAEQVDESGYAEAAVRYATALARLPWRMHPLVAPYAAAAQQARDKKAWPEAVAKARVAYFLATLLEFPAGAELAAAAAVVPKAPPAKPSANGGGPVGMDGGWSVIGPFDNGDWKAYARTIVDPAHVDVQKPVEGVKWLKPGDDAYTAAGGGIDFNRLFGRDNSVGFAYRTYDVDDASLGIITCGSDDGLTLWVNGEKIYEDREQRGVNPNSLRFEVRLKPGRNEVLARIQQSSGGWGFQLLLSTSGGNSLAPHLSAMGVYPDSHAVLGRLFAAAVGPMADAGQVEAAFALARTIARCFPERFDAANGALARWIANPGALTDPTDAADLARWLDAALTRNDRVWNAKDRMGGIDERRSRVSGLAVRAGDLELLRWSGARRRHGSVGVGFDDRARWRGVSDIGNAWRLAGDLRRAMAHFRQALDCGVDDDGVRNGLNQAVYLQRRTLLGDRAAVQLDPDAGTQLASADRAGASDPERAVRAYQAALDAQSAQLVRPATAAATTDGSSADAVGVDVFIGAATYAAERIRALGDKGLAGYRALVDGRALDRMRSAQDANDLDALVRLAAIYAPSPVAAQALSQAANLAMEAGRQQQAVDLLTRALLGLPVATPERPLLLAKLATVALAAGDAARARTALDRLGKDHAAATVTISGVTQPVATVVAGLRTQLEALRPAAPEGQPFAGARRTNAVGFAPRPGSVAGIINLPVPVADRAYDLRLTPTAWRHLPWFPIVADGVAYVNTLDEVLAIDLVAPAATALRWRSGPNRSARDEHFAGQIEQQPAVEGGLIAARVLLPNARAPSAPARFALEVRAVRDGQLRWSTATMPELASSSAVSSPALVHGSVYALFQDQADSNGARQLCAFDTTGALRWRTALPSGAAEIRAGDSRIACSEHAAAPTVDDGEVYVCGDGGTVAAFTAANGAVRWVAAYMRGYFDTTDGRQVLRTLANRAASRVVVGADAVYVAPRDTLAVFALARANGASLWTRALSRTVAIAALDEGSNRAQLLLQDDGLNALDARTGAPRWRWRPLGEAHLTGISAVGGDAVYATTDSSLVRLRLADGALLGSDAWSKLGLDGALGNLVLTPTAIVGTERGRLAWMKVGEPAANVARVTPLTLAGPAVAMATTRMLNPQLPAAPFAPPLALRWKLPGNGLIGMFPAADRVDGDTYVAFADRLLRIDSGSGTVRWEATLEPGVRRIEPGLRAVVAIGPRSCAGYDPDTGTLLWLRANVQDDAGWSFGKRANEIWQPGVVSDGERVSFTQQDGRGVEVLDARSGKRSAQLRFSAGSRWIGVRGDEVIAVLQDDQRLWVQAQPLSAGAPTWNQELKTPDRNWGSPMTLCSGDGTKLYLISNRGVIALDLVAHKELFNDGTFLGEGSSGWIDQGYLYLIGKRDGGWQERILDASTGTLRYARKMLGGDNFNAAAVWRIAADGAVHIDVQAAGDQVRIELAALADGKQRWAFNLGQRGIRQPWDMRVCGGWIVSLSGVDEGRVGHYQVLDMATGAIAADAPLPGGKGSDRTGGWLPLVLGDLLVYAGTDGVYALGGATTAAVQTAVKAPTEAGSWLADVIAPTPRVAFATRAPLTADNDAGWVSTAEIALDQPGDWRPATAATANGMRATVRCAWSRVGLGVLVTVTNAQVQTPALGEQWDDADSVTIGIDPEASRFGRQDPSQPLVFQLAAVAGETRLVQRVGHTPEEEDERPQAAALRTAAGVTYRLVVPWAALRPNAGERPGSRPQLRLGVLVGHGQRGALELGHGLARGLDARSFVPLTAVDLTPERIAGFGRFAQLLPSHSLTWKFMQNLLLAYPGTAGARERERIYADFLRANPNSDYAVSALLALVEALRDSGEPDPVAVAAARAQAAKMPARAIGDALGREHAGGEGRVITQWVFIDPVKPPRTLMLQFCIGGDWEHRAYWGENAIQWGADGTVARQRLGDLPPAGQWVQLTVPIALLGPLGKPVESIAWAQCDGVVTWDRCELVDGQQTTVLIDDDLPKNRTFTRGGWVNSPTKSGKRAWSLGTPSGTAEMHFDGGQALFVIKVDANAAPAVTPAVRLEAAAAIVDEPEVLTLLREAEAGGDVQSLYRDFLRAHAQSSQAAALLNRLREVVEDGKPERRATAIAAGETLMEELKLPRDQRRAFYREVTPALSAWWLCGWFDGGLESSNLQMTLPPEQSAFDPKQTFTIGGASIGGASIGGAGAGWKPITGEWWGLEPRKAANPGSNWAVCYVATTVEAPRQLDANVFIGVRGWAQLWLNGVRVGPNLGVGLSGLERDHDVLPVTLRKGRNELLVKLLWAEAQLSLRLADANGRPIEGLVLPTR